MFFKLFYVETKKIDGLPRPSRLAFHRLATITFPHIVSIPSATPAAFDSNTVENVFSQFAALSANVKGTVGEFAALQSKIAYASMLKQLGRTVTGLHTGGSKKTNFFDNG
jgi:hypothetical protein